MKYKNLLATVIMFTGIFLLTGCLQSETEIMDEADNRLKEVFLSNEKIETNFEVNRFSLYKPESFSVKDESKHNIIFYQDEQPFILFINNLEKPNSKWYYNELKAMEDELLYLSSFETEEKFAYFSVREREDEQFEVQLGIGGIKMATLSELDQVNDDVEQMIKIVKSVQKK